MGRRKNRNVGPSGVVVIDKPIGPTSFSVLRQVQRTLGAGRGGHAGTLDPAASGVLVALLGEATKLSDWIMAEDKRYVARIQLGSQTTTLDAEGDVVATSAVPKARLADLVGATASTENPGSGALSGLVGTYPQVPPRFSAIKRQGRSLMSRARAGEEFEPEPRQVTCHSIEVLALDVDAGWVDVDIASAKGFYVRALARDLATALGTHGHLTALRRTRSGRFTVEQAVAPEALTPSNILPLQEAVGDDVVKVRVERPRDLQYISVGRSIPMGTSLSVAFGNSSKRALLIGPDGVALAMARTDETGEFWKISRGLNVRRDEMESR